ncbi:MAG: PAS domain S-box protein [Longimicrobiales bacterium]
MGTALSGDEYRAIFEASPDGCLVVDRNGAIRAANPRMEELFGWTEAELMGKRVDVLVPDAVRPTHESHRARFVADPHNRPMGVGLDLRAQRKDGTTFPVEISLSPWKAEARDLYVICTLRDVSEYRRLQDFSEGALRATEEERQRIARELHDDTAQRLATLILRTRRLALEPSADARAELLEQIREEIVDAADGVKRMARGLRPPEIEELGLALAITAHVRSLREGTSFVVETELGQVDQDLSVTAKLAMYRIVQEALSNARRHAGAERVRVRLVREGAMVVAEVVDDGRGFLSSRAVEGGGGLGLLGMRERATMIGGRLTVESEPGRGTTVRVAVPVQELGREA